MKRAAALLLLLVLLAGCAGPPTSPEGTSAASTSRETRTETASETESPHTEAPDPETSAPGTEAPTEPETETADTKAPPEPETETADTEAPPETAAPARSGLAALVDGEHLLFFRQDQLRGGELPEEHRGDLLSLEALQSWHGAQERLPRTRYYDDAFADCPVLLELMDYCISEGYAGVTFPTELLGGRSLTADRMTKLYWMYRIDNTYPDYAEFRGGPGGGRYSAIWFTCPQPDSVARFHTALEKARQIVAEMPPELDDYDRAQYLYSWLKTNVEYNRLNLNYYDHDWYFLYDALIDGVCVCTGYSDALYYLYNLAGVDCVCITGHVEASDINESQDHQWNAAALYGTYYCFDVTWDDSLLYNSGNSFFAVSEGMMNGISRRTKYAPLEALFPRCGEGFRPPADWNQTPEGALRSWLWLREYCFGSMARSYLLQTDQMLYSDPPLRFLSGSFAVYDLDYAEVVESFMPYITRTCFLKGFEGKCFRNEDGRLAVSTAAGTDARYRIESVSGEGGRYTARLVSDSGGRATASFTVAEEKGRCRINTVSLREE